MHVRVPPGTELRLPPGTWRQGERGGRGELRVRVGRLMPELSGQAAPGEVWVAGTKLRTGGSWDGQIHACVQIAAVVDQLD